jgi:hypothetical protein
MDGKADFIIVGGQFVLKKNTDHIEYSLTLLRRNRRSPSREPPHKNEDRAHSPSNRGGQ